MRKHDFTIGEPDDPAILRWYLIPRNPLFNLYLHQLLRSDNDEALHDHPWWNLSIILRGYYMEVFKDYPVWRNQGDWIFRRAKTPHRIVVLEPCWTLFITGPKFREWGFHCPKGWVSFKDFTNRTKTTSSLGKGCA